MTSRKVRSIINKLGRARSQSTTNLSFWSKSDDKLMRAVQCLDGKKVNSILSKKVVTPSKLGPHGHSVFHMACEVGNLHIVELLIGEVEDIDDLTLQGSTSLHLAAIKGHEEVLKQLLQRGADVNMKDRVGMNALHHAVAGGRAHCTAILLQSKADVRHTDDVGKTALFYAACIGDAKICELLASYEADVNAKDNLGVTPLMLAAREGYCDVCRFLLRRGVDPTSRDLEGHDALQYAGDGGYAEFDKLLSDTNINTSCKSSLSGSSATQIRENILKNDEWPDFTRSVFPLQEASIWHSDSAVACGDTTSTAACLTAPGILCVKETKEFKELEAENELLNGKFKDLWMKNLRLQDKLDFLQQRSIPEHVINDEEKNATQGRKELSSIDVEVQCELSDLPSIYQTSVSDVDENCKAPLDKGIVQMSSALMEDVEFDEEGFVDGKDLTKEEFLQTRNEQLKTQCRLLTSELVKLQEEFNAILNAGDDLQLDYDTLTEARDVLHQDLRVAVAEKNEVIEENHVLLDDRNAMNEDVQRLVLELEKMQLMHNKMAAMKDELQNNHDTIAGERDSSAKQQSRTELDPSKLLMEEEQLELIPADASGGGYLDDGNRILPSVPRLLEETEEYIIQREQLELTIYELSEENSVLERQLEALRSSTSDTDTLLRVAEERAHLADTVQRLQNDNYALSVENGKLEDALVYTHSQVMKLEAALETRDGHCREASLIASISALESTVEELSCESASKSEILRLLGLESDGRQRRKDDSSVMTVAEGTQTSALDNYKLDGNLVSLNYNQNNVAWFEDDGREVNGFTKNIDSASLIAMDTDSAHIKRLKQQLTEMSLRLQEMERTHLSALHTYRTHLLSAVQGRLDPTVKEALHCIIQMRSKEQFC